MNDTMTEYRTEENLTHRGEHSRKPVHRVRRGPVTATIWLKQSETGYYYYSFSLSRSWKSAASGKAGFSRSFFERHRDHLIEVILAATEWIEERHANATTTVVDTTKAAA